jgi:serpin B
MNLRKPLPPQLRLPLTILAVMTLAMMGCPPVQTVEDWPVEQPPKNPWTSTSLTPAQPDAQVIAEAAKQNNLFAYELMDEFPPESKNLAVSPFGIAQLLAIAAAGADKSVQYDLLVLLKEPKSKLTPHDFGQFGQVIRNSGNVAPFITRDERAPRVAPVSSHIAVWPTSSIPIWPQYPAIMEDWFAAHVQPLDYSNPKAAAAHINAWVKKISLGRMPGSITPESLTPAPYLILSGVVSLKARWLFPCEREYTKPADFRLLDGKTIQVPMMRTTLYNARYLQTDNFRAIDIPCELDSDLVMRIVLPNEDNIDEILYSARHGRLTTPYLLDKLWGPGPGTLQAQTLKVDLRLPKFQLECVTPIHDTFRYLKDENVFKHADMSGIFQPSIPIPTAAITQTCIIQVNEEGIEAGAETEIDYPGALQIKPPPQFYVDRPFYFEILNTQTRAILFMGVVTDPHLQ